MTNSKQTEKQLKKEKEEIRAYALLLQGYSYSQIAAAMKISKATARNRVKAVMLDNSEASLETLRDFRNVELARMDDLFMKAYQGEKNAVDVYDEETGELIRSGSKDKVLFMNQMIQISKHRSSMLNFTSIPEIQKSEARELQDLNVEYMSPDDILHTLAENTRLKNEQSN